MTQEDKELLLQDLCARLPYGVIIGETETVKSGKFEPEFDLDTLISVDVTSSEYDNETFKTNGENDFFIEEFKPFLRAMSSMTEEEKMEYDGFLYGLCDFTQNCENFKPIDKLMNWLNEHHFDYRGLIKKGLAIEAPEGMYEIKSESEIPERPTSIEL